MSVKTMLDTASDYAFAQLAANGNDPMKLPVPLGTVVVIYSAQGIIDNGGLEYFYENDFPGNPPYSYFVDAYRRIGATQAADCIEKTASMLRFKEPHLYAKQRREFLASLESDPLPIFSELSSRICGDKSVWEKLANYVAANKKHFAA